MREAGIIFVSVSREMLGLLREDSRTDYNLVLYIGCRTRALSMIQTAEEDFNLQKSGVPLHWPEAVCISKDLACDSRPLVSDA